MSPEYRRRGGNLAGRRCFRFGRERNQQGKSGHHGLRVFDHLHSSLDESFLGANHGAQGSHVFKFELVDRGLDYQTTSSGFIRQLGCNQNRVYI